MKRTKVVKETKPKATKLVVAVNPVPDNKKVRCEKCAYWHRKKVTEGMWVGNCAKKVRTVTRANFSCPEWKEIPNG